MNPTAEQIEYLKRACGIRLFIYNWARAEWEKQYQEFKQEQETVSERVPMLAQPCSSLPVGFLPRNGVPVVGR